MSIGKVAAALLGRSHERRRDTPQTAMRIM
jgi:hypothetical protein